MAIGIERRWEGSRNFGPAVRLANAINRRSPITPTDEEVFVGKTMAGMLEVARPIVCPPEQLNAVADDVFRDFGEALEYAAIARLPFEVVFFDFTDELGQAPSMHFHMVEEGQELGFELRGVLAGEEPEQEETIFVPIIGSPNEPPEEIGLVLVDWSKDRRGAAKPGRWVETLERPGHERLDVTFFNPAAAMQAIGETPRAVAGALMGVARASSGIPAGQVEAFKFNLAAASGTAVRMALKALYLLDSANVEISEAPLSRQARRQADRKGTNIAWIIRVRPPQSAERESDEQGKRSFSHRFEVRGNFAHYKEGGWLYEHSDPEDIRPCPRCGRCRRVWRQPHIKGPVDKPLAIRVRRVDLA
jgi:hypothetical protein